MELTGRTGHRPSWSTKRSTSLVPRCQAWKGLLAVLRETGAGPLRPPPGTPELGTVTHCPTQCFKPMLRGHLPSGTHYQVSEYTHGSSSPTKTSVTFQRIVSLPKTATRDASTCHSTRNAQSGRGLEKSPHQIGTLRCRAIYCINTLNFMPGCFHNLQWKFQEDSSVPRAARPTNPSSPASKEASSRAKGLAGQIQSAKLSQNRRELCPCGAPDWKLGGPNSAWTCHKYTPLLSLHCSSF